PAPLDRRRARGRPRLRGRRRGDPADVPLPDLTMDPGREPSRLGHRRHELHRHRMRPHARGRSPLRLGESPDLLRVEHRVPRRHRRGAGDPHGLEFPPPRRELTALRGPGVVSVHRYTATETKGTDMTLPLREVVETNLA